MLMLTRRLQILIDEGRYERVSSEARSRGVPVAVIVREAIDRSFRNVTPAWRVMPGGKSRI